VDAPSVIAVDTAAVPSDQLKARTQFTVIARENVERTLTPYVTLNAGARARWHGLTAFLTITNLLNDAHETFGTFARNPRAAGAPVEPFLTPSPPIHVDVGVAYRF